jgi:hypothetical protein
MRLQPMSFGDRRGTDQGAPLPSLSSPNHGGNLAPNETPSSAMIGERLSVQTDFGQHGIL